jgi:hypothetical protein
MGQAKAMSREAEWELSRRDRCSSSRGRQRDREDTEGSRRGQQGQCWQAPRSVHEHLGMQRCCAIAYGVFSCTATTSHTTRNQSAIQGSS